MKKTFFLTFALVFTSLFLSIAIQSDATITVPVSMSPYKIILNAECKGSSQDIQAIVSISPANYEKIKGNTINIRFGEGGPTSKTTSYKYCIIDANLLVSFNRTEIQKELIEDDIKGVIEVTVNDTDSDGNIFFIGTSTVEIIAPGNKK